MKKILLFVTILLNTIATAQVGINTTTPDATFEIAPTSKTAPSNTDGFLVPRITNFPAINPTTNQQGMLVYLTAPVGSNLPGFYYWNNPTTSWLTIAGASTAGWDLTGNIVDSNINFLGSINNADVVFKRNGLESGRIAQTNTSYGLSTLISNTAGNNGTAIGFQALHNNTSGTNNTANGASALYSNTIGLANTAIGRAALYSNVNGSFNTAVGRNTLFSNTLGSYNTGTGHESLINNTSGTYNVANGSQSLNRNIIGNENSAIGYQSLFNNNFGNQNTASGFQSLYTSTNGNSNTGLGYKSDASPGINNATAIGSKAMVTSSNSLVLGSINGINSAEATVKVGIGTTAPTERLHIDGKIRVVDGTQASGRVLTSDANGVASWQAAGSSNWNLTGNTVNPSSDFLGSTNDADVIFKRSTFQAGRISTSNSSYGLLSLNNITTGFNNSAFGAFALDRNTTGIWNTAFGYEALQYNTTGASNISIGGQTSRFNSVGSRNTAIGGGALSFNTSGNDNTAIGYWAGSLLTTGSNNIFIGYNTNSYSNSASNFINIGNQIYGNNGLIGIGTNNPTRAKLVVNGAVNTNNGAYGYLNNAGATGTSNSTNANPTSIWASGRIISSEFNATSDNRVKQNIIPVQNALSTLSKLNIVNYTKLSKDGATSEIGVIAQELEKFVPQAVYQSEGDIYNATTNTWQVVQDFRTVNYQTINMITAKAVQELQIEVDKRKSEIAALKEENKQLELRLQKIEALLKR